MLIAAAGITVFLLFMPGFVLLYKNPYGQSPWIRLALSSVPIWVIYGIFSWGWWLSELVVKKTIIANIWSSLSVGISLTVLTVGLIYNFLGCRASREKSYKPNFAIRKFISQKSGGEIIFALSLVTAVIVLFVPWVTNAIGLDFPVLHQDALFHGAVSHHLTYDGSISPFSSSSLFQDHNQKVFYPSLLYALTGVVSSYTNSSVALISFSLVVALMGHIVCVCALIKNLFPAIKIIALAPLLAVAVTIYPVFQLFLHGQYPLVLGIVSLEQFLVVYSLPANKNERTVSQIRWRYLFLVLTAWVTFCAHPSIFIIIIGFVVVDILVRIAKTWVSAVAAIGISILILLLIGVVSNNPWVYKLLNFHRDGYGPLYTLSMVLFGATPSTAEAGMWSYSFGFVLLIGAGIVVSIIGRHSLLKVLPPSRQMLIRSFAITWLGCAGLCVIAAMEDNWLRSYTLFWYKDPDRLYAISSIFIPILLMVGLEAASMLIAYVSRMLSETLRCKGNFPKLTEFFSRKHLEASGWINILCVGLLLAVVTLGFGWQPRGAIIYGGQHYPKATGEVSLKRNPNTVAARSSADSMTSAEKLSASQPDIANRPNKAKTNQTAETIKLAANEISPVMATVQKYETMKNYGKKLNATDTVLVDPLLGGLLLQQTSYAKVLPKRVSIGEYPEDIEKAYKEVNSIDGKSCKRLRELGITHVITDKNKATVYGVGRLVTGDITTQPLWRTYFDLVDQHEGITLWALKRCLS